MYRPILGHVYLYFTFDKHHFLSKLEVGAPSLSMNRCTPPQILFFYREQRELCFLHYTGGRGVRPMYRSQEVRLSTTALTQHPPQIIEVFTIN